jgi:type 1 fimbria pilin
MKNIKPFILTLLMSIAVACSSNDSDSNTTTNYNLQVTGILKTNTCDITTNSYSVKLEYLSDGDILNPQQWNGNTEQIVNENSTISGSIVGVRIKLMNFNSTNQNIGRGTGLRNIHIKITNADTNEILIDQDSSSDLFICTDSVYQADFLYNTTNGTFNPNFLTFGF